jgi:hypothetical protein
MTERKYTLDELMGYTNGKSNYWEIHKNDVGHVRDLVSIGEYNDFESWEDQNFLWFNMLDRGIIFCILKDRMDMFLNQFGKTKESKHFSSELDESHWRVQFLYTSGGFTLSIPKEELEDFWNKLISTVEVSTYEQYVTHVGDEE